MTYGEFMKDWLVAQSMEMGRGSLAMRFSMLDIEKLDAMHEEDGVCFPPTTLFNWELYGSLNQMAKDDMEFETNVILDTFMDMYRERWSVKD